MNMPAEYLDVGRAIAGGWRVSLVRRSGRFDRIIANVLIETPCDVAAAARLCGLSVLSSEDAITQACDALGVAVLMPPPARQEYLPI